MTTTGKVVIVGTAGVALLATGYYFFFVRKTKAAAAAAMTTIQQGVTAAGNATGRSLTVESLRARQWTNPVGTIIPKSSIEAYDPITGVVTHADHAWSGILLNDGKTISWTKNNGETQSWKCTGNCDALAGVNLLNLRN